MWLNHCEHMLVIFFAVSLPSQSTTEQASLKKVTTITYLVLGQKLDTEETRKQKKLK